MPDGKTELWLASLDSREPPRAIPGSTGDDAPKFGPAGKIVFRRFVGSSAFLYVGAYTGGASRQLGELSGNVNGTISPDGKWITGMAAAVGSSNSNMTLFSIDGRERRPVVPAQARIRWTPDGHRAYISFQHGQQNAFGIGKTYVLPLKAGQVIPEIPDGGFKAEAEIAALPGVVAVPHGDIAFGSSPDVYVYSRMTTTRNLYRIPLVD